MKTLATLTLIVATGLSAAAQAQEAIPAEVANRHVGKTGMVCGKVERTRHAQNTEGQPTFLYMGGAYPRHTFSARISSDIRDSFRPTPEELEGQDVCVVGTIARDSNRAEIVVSSASSIKLAQIK